MVYSGEAEVLSALKAFADVLCVTYVFFRSRYSALVWCCAILKTFRLIPKLETIWNTSPTFTTHYEAN